MKTKIAALYIREKYIIIQYLVQEYRTHFDIKTNYVKFTEDSS